MNQAEVGLGERYLAEAWRMKPVIDAELCHCSVWLRRKKSCWLKGGRMGNETHDQCVALSLLGLFVVVIARPKAMAWVSSWSVPFLGCPLCISRMLCLARQNWSPFLAALRSSLFVGSMACYCGQTDSLLLVGWLLRSAKD